MAFNNSFTAVVGATYTAAQYNTHVRDNFSAMWVYTTAGDIVYASSATTLARLGLVAGGVMYGGASAPAWLAKPSVDSLLKNTSAGVPSWLAIAGLPGRLHTYGTAFSDSGTSTTSTSYASIGSGISVALTLAYTCVVLAFAFGRGSKNSGVSDGKFGIDIAGTQDPSDKVQIRSTTGENFSTWYYRTGITAGSRSVELKYKTDNAGDATGFSRGGLLAMAFVA